MEEVGEQRLKKAVEEGGALSLLSSARVLDFVAPANSTSPSLFRSQRRVAIQGSQTDRKVAKRGRRKCLCRPRGKARRLRNDKGWPCHQKSLPFCRIKQSRSRRLNPTARRFSLIYAQRLVLRRQRAPRSRFGVLIARTVCVWRAGRDRMQSLQFCCPSWRQAAATALRNPLSLSLSLLKPLARS